ncbi:MAG: LEPR-XLL domain-containing protein, partial [Nitrospirae bacterium]|nr:LEPR-XLL domain-containing protein [Nitrospirota bacterium]
MKLAQLLSLYNNLIRCEPRTMRKSVPKQPRQRASAFVLESLENRVLLSATPMAAEVTTDKLDYAPGETAVITTSNTNSSTDGAIFGDGELVQFQVTRTDGIQDAPMGNVPWFVIDGMGGDAYQQFIANGQTIDLNADGIADLIRPDNDLTVNGSISTDWFVEDQYLGASLLLTATGQDSGAVATTAFTDSAAFTSSISPTSVTYGSSGSITLTVTNANTGNTKNTVGSFTVDKPSGFTISGNPTILAYDSPGTISPQAWTYDSANSTTAYWAFKATASGQSIDNTGRAEVTFGAGVLTANTLGNQTFTVNAYNNTSYGGGTFTLTGSQASVNITAASTSVGSVTASTSTFGGTTNLSATVAPAGVTGSVNFYINGSATAVAGTYNSGTGVATVTGYTHGLNASGTAYSVKAVFTSSNTNYNGSETTSAALVVNKATAVVTVTGYTGAYDAAAHGASGTVVGVAGDLTAAGSSLTLGASFTNAPGGTANWTFT